jgi:hypothetical protein
VAVASFLAAVLTEIYLCDVCSCREILRRNGRGQGAASPGGAGGVDLETFGECLARHGLMLPPQRLAKLPRVSGFPALIDYERFLGTAEEGADSEPGRAPVQGLQRLQAEVAGLRRAVRGSWAQLLRAVNAAAAAAVRERADDSTHIGGVRRLIGADELRVLVMRHCGVVCTDAAWDAVCDGCGGAASVASF